MSSEIDSQQSRDQQPPLSTSGEKSLRNDVYTAAAYGDLEKLQRLVEQEGCSVSEPDGSGYYALQWAALNNHTAAAQYIIEHGGDVNATDHTGQTALHWSASKGAIEVAELLLQKGARVNSAGMKGYQTTHVAAEFGQTAFLYHIVSKWNADPDVPDNNGRSPLHWAAYKGFADCIRLLLVLDAHRGRQDEEGYTPLHWAVISGNLKACTVLVKGGKKEDLMVTDNTGLTPTQLASAMNRTQVAHFLGDAMSQLDEHTDDSLVAWCTNFVLLVTYIRSVIMAKNMPKLTATTGLLARFGVLLATAGSVMFYRCSNKDPGIIKMNVHDTQNMIDDKPILKIEINNPALLDENWSKLCTTCKIVKLRRTKHCSTCDCCVEQFDHHCTFLNNCVGKNNIWDFALFLVLEASAMLVTGGVCLTRLLTNPLAPSSFGAWIRYVGKNHVGAISFLIADFFLLLFVFTFTVVHVWLISHNLTTNEWLNDSRYSYLRGPDGRFRNPYDHGIKKNCSDFWIKGYNEDVECVEELRHSEEGNGNGHVVSNNVNSYITISKTHHGHMNGRVHDHEATTKNIYRYSEWIYMVDIGEETVFPKGVGKHIDASRYLIAGGVAGAVSRTATAPLNRLKVVLQVQTTRARIMPAIKDIWREGGFLGFFRGNGLNVLKVAPESAIRFYTYEMLKTFTVNAKGEGSKTNIGAAEWLLAGSIAGAVTQTAIYPMDLVKTRLQTYASASGKIPSLRTLSKDIWVQEGPRAFYKGLIPSLLGIIPYVGIDLAAYETLKDMSKKYILHDKEPGPLVQLGCGTVSGALGAACVYPLQVVRTRMQAQRSYKGMTDVFRKTLEHEGFRGFYKGMFPNLLKVVPSASITYMVYESMKKGLDLE